MSIVQNLKILNKPIAELAMLPQESIIRLAQMGQIPVGFVAPILGEKAEQSKASAAAAAMMSQQTPQPTVLEKIMAENAVAELPEDIGIGALPVSDDALPKEFAGGGIIAFSNGGRSQADIERILREAQQGRGPNVSRPSGINTLPQGLTPEDTPFTFEEEEEVVEEDVPMPSARLSDIDIQSLLDRSEGIVSNLRPARTQEVPTIEQASQQTSDILAASGYDTSVLDQIRQDVQRQRESLKEDRSEAMNLRLLEAGLAIMGGTSPYAFENIGKGATGAVKGLAQDIKDLKKSERDLRSAEQNLLLKQNEAAMGKARITQATIDKAQERVDRERENDARMKADFAKTMLSGEIQERLARATYGSRMTDFDKKWKIYTDSLPKGEKPNPSGFAAMWGEGRVTISEKDATKMAQEYLKMDPPDLSTPEGRARFEEIKNYFMRQGGTSRPSAGGKAPPLPSGFIEQ